MITDALLSAVEILNIKKFIRMRNINEINIFCKLTDDVIINNILNNKKLLKAKALVSRVIKKENLYNYLGEFTIKSDSRDQRDHMKLRIFLLIRIFLQI
jgi:hypothetical protein